MKSPRRRLVLWVLGLLVGIPALLVCALVAWELYLALVGRAELAAVQRDLLARGEKLELTELAPPPVPDEENFFAAPLWTERAGQKDLPKLFADVGDDEAAELRNRFPPLAEKIQSGGRFVAVREVLPKSEERQPTPEEAALALALLEPARPALDEIARLAKRPAARYPIDYGRGLSMRFPHSTDLLSSAQMLMARGRAELALGRTAAALDDALLVFRLAETIESEPLLISLLVRISILDIGLSLVESGLPFWNDTEVLALERELSSINVGPQFLASLRGERVFANAALALSSKQKSSLAGLVESAAIGSGQPPGLPLGTRLILDAYALFFLPGDAAFLNRTYQTWIDDLEEHGGLPAPGRTRNAADITGEIESAPAGRLRNFLTFVTLAPIEGAFTRTAFIQGRIDLAHTACMVQRFVLARGRLPSSLDELVPDFTEAVPLDPMDGKPLRYRVDATGATIWSIGWNQTDESGVANDRRKPDQGDWVWKIPAPKPE